MFFKFKFDFLNLFAVGFLIVSLLTVTVVTNNKDFTANFLGKAKTIVNKGPSAYDVKHAAADAQKAADKADAAQANAEGADSVAANQKAADALAAAAAAAQSAAKVANDRAASTGNSQDAAAAKNALDTASNALYTAQIAQNKTQNPGSSTTTSTVPAGKCDANGTAYNPGDVVVYSSGANDYRKCGADGLWVKDSNLKITDLTPAYVPTYLQPTYNKAVTDKKVADVAAAALTTADLHNDVKTPQPVAPTVTQPTATDKLVLMKNCQSSGNVWNSTSSSCGEKPKQIVVVPPVVQTDIEQNRINNPPVLNTTNTTISSNALTNFLSTMFNSTSLNGIGMPNGVGGGNAALTAPNCSSGDTQCFQNYQNAVFGGMAAGGAIGGSLIGAPIVGSAIITTGTAAMTYGGVYGSALLGAAPAGVQTLITAVAPYVIPATVIGTTLPQAIEIFVCNHSIAGCTPEKRAEIQDSWFMGIIGGQQVQEAAVLSPEINPVNMAKKLTTTQNTARVVDNAVVANSIDDATGMLFAPNEVPQISLARSLGQGLQINASNYADDIANRAVQSPLIGGNIADDVVSGLNNVDDLANQLANAPSAIHITDLPTEVPAVAEPQPNVLQSTWKKVTGFFQSPASEQGGALNVTNASKTVANQAENVSDAVVANRSTAQRLVDDIKLQADDLATNAQGWFSKNVSTPIGDRFFNIKPLENLTDGVVPVPKVPVKSTTIDPAIQADLNDATLPQNRIAQKVAELEPKDPNLANKLLDDHLALKQEYSLPPKDLSFSNPEEYQKELESVASAHNIQILYVDPSTDPVFSRNPLAGAYYEASNNSIVFKSDAPPSIANFEHELTHALQHEMFPNMPIEEQEYQAWVVANMSINPTRLADPEFRLKLFNNVSASVDNYYVNDQGIPNPWATPASPPTFFQKALPWLYNNKGKLIILGTGVAVGDVVIQNYDRIQSTIGGWINGLSALIPQNQATTNVQTDVVKKVQDVVTNPKSVDVINTSQDQQNTNQEIQNQQKVDQTVQNTLSTINNLSKVSENKNTSSNQFVNGDVLVTAVVGGNTGLRYSPTFVPDNLVTLNKTIAGAKFDLWTPAKMRKETVDPVQAWVKWVNEQGYTPLISSAYRDYKTQEAYSSSYGNQAASPGGSCHQSGLCFDVHDFIDNKTGVRYEVCTDPTKPVCEFNIKAQEKAAELGIAHPYNWDQPHYFVAVAADPSIVPFIEQQQAAIENQPMGVDYIDALNNELLKKQQEYNSTVGFSTTNNSEYVNLP